MNRYLPLLITVASILTSHASAAIISDVFSEDIDAFIWEFGFDGTYDGGFVSHSSDAQYWPSTVIGATTPNRLFITANHKVDPHNLALDSGGFYTFGIDTLSLAVAPLPVEIASAHQTHRHVDSGGVRHFDEYWLYYTALGGNDRSVSFTLAGTHRSVVPESGPTAGLLFLGLMACCLWSRHAVRPIR